MLSINACDIDPVAVMCDSINDRISQWTVIEYYGAAEPPVRCGESHLSGLTEPPHFVY